MNVNEILQSLVKSYGDGSDGSAPTADQWRTVLNRDPNAPFALVNFFKFNTSPVETRTGERLPSGGEAFQKYADVSVPAMQAAGGSFLTVSAFAGTMLGPDQDWDLVAIGRYPNLQAFLGLYQNPEYIDAFDYRIAAVASQFVIVIEQ